MPGRGGRGPGAPVYSGTTHFLQVVERAGQEEHLLLVMATQGNGEALDTRVRLPPLPHSVSPATPTRTRVSGASETEPNNRPTQQFKAGAHGYKGLASSYAKRLSLVLNNEIIGPNSELTETSLQPQVQALLSSPPSDR